MPRFPSEGLGVGAENAYVDLLLPLPGPFAGNIRVHGEWKVQRALDGPDQEQDAQEELVSYIYQEWSWEEIMVLRACLARPGIILP